MKYLDLSELAKTVDSASEKGPSTVDNLEDDVRVTISDTESNILLKEHLIIMCMNGSFSFISGSGEHSCTGGMFCILVKDSFCRFLSVSEDCKIAVLSSKTNMFHLAASSLPNLMLFYRHFREKPMFRMSSHELQDAKSMFDIIKALSSRSEYIYRKEIGQALDAALFYILFAHVERVSDTPSRFLTRSRTIYCTFLEQVREHFRENRRLDYYANLQCITTKHLSAAVKKESGVSASQWINDFVMIEARNLLSNSNLSIQEVADKLNFLNQSIFGKYFKSHEGMGPMQYKQKSI